MKTTSDHQKNLTKDFLSYVDTFAKTHPDKAEIMEGIFRALLEMEKHDGYREGWDEGYKVAEDNFKSTIQSNKQ